MLDRDPDRTIAQLLQIAKELGWTPPGDVIDQIIGGGLLTTAMAAEACEVTPKTIRCWMEDAAAKGRPLGVLSPAVNLIGLERLLDYVEAEQGLHARIKIKNRAAKFANVWAGPLSLKKGHAA